MPASTSTSRTATPPLKSRHAPAATPAARRWAQGWAALFTALTPLTAADLDRTITIRGEPLTVLQAVQRQLTHYAYHVGQIVYIAKHFAGPRWQSLSIAPGQSAAFNRAPVWLALAISSVGFAGMFCVFSYMAPTLLEVTRLDARWIPLALATFGLGGILGNMFGGWLFDRLRFQAVAWLLLWSALVLALFPLAAQSPWSLFPAIFAVGTMVALSPALQTHLMDVAHGAQTLAAASNHAAFNTANALGPWLGGMAIGGGFGYASTGYVGAATAAAGLLLWGVSVLIERRRVTGSLAVDASNG